MDPPPALAEEQFERGERAAPGIELDEIAVGGAERRRGLAAALAPGALIGGARALAAGEHPAATAFRVLQHERGGAHGQGGLGSIGDAQADHVMAPARARQGLGEARLVGRLVEEEVADQEAHAASLGDPRQLVEGMRQVGAPGGGLGGEHLAQQAGDMLAPLARGQVQLGAVAEGDQADAVIVAQGGDRHHCRRLGREAELGARRDPGYGAEAHRAADVDEQEGAEPRVPRGRP